MECIDGLAARDEHGPRVDQAAVSAARSEAGACAVAAGRRVMAHEGETIRCWCGAEDIYAELFDESGLSDSCMGTGVLDCYCGGDACVCHHHGEVDCPGCEDCEDGLLDAYTG